MTTGQKEIEWIKKKEIIFPLFILFLILLNSFLKFYGIGKSSFWIDEAYSVSLAQRDIAEIIKTCSSTDNPPFYFVLLHYWSKVFGISETAVRSMSAVFSISTVILLFHFVNKNIGFTTAIFVSLIFSLSGQHLYYAQETRNYAVVIFLSVLSAGFYLELFSSGKKSTLVFITLTNILLICTHYIAGFLLACEGIVALFFISGNRKFFLKFSLSCILVLLILAPWISNVINNIPEEGKFWLQKPTFYNFKGVYIDFAGNKISIVIMFAIIAAGAFRIFRQWKAERNPMILIQPVFYLTWAFVTVVTIYLVAMARPVFLTRYLLFCSIGLYLSTGYFLAALNLSGKLKTSIAVILLASMSFSLQLHPEREEHWREAVDYVKKIKTGEDVVVVSVWYTNKIFSYYYDKNIFLEYNGIDKRLKAQNIFPTSQMDLNTFRLLPSSKRIILIQSHQVDDDPQNSVMNTLTSQAKKTATIDFNKVQVHVFERTQL
jgi:hypothetical protein